MQMSYLYKPDFPFENFCKLAQHVETIRKNVWERSNYAHSLSIRVQTTFDKPHFNLFFTTISTSKKVFFLSASWKRPCVTQRREQRGMDSNRQRQISQSDCEISSYCGKILFLLHIFYFQLHIAKIIQNTVTGSFKQLWIRFSSASSLLKDVSFYKVKLRED